MNTPTAGSSPNSKKAIPAGGKAQRIGTLKGGKTQNPYAKQIPRAASPLGNTPQAASPASSQASGSDRELSPVQENDAPDETAQEVKEPEKDQEVKEPEKDQEGKETKEGEEEEEDDDEFLPNESSREVQLIRDQVERHKEEQAYVCESTC